MDNKVLNEEYALQIGLYLKAARKSQKLTTGSLAIATLFVINYEKVAKFVGPIHTWVAVTILIIIGLLGLILERLYDSMESQLEFAKISNADPLSGERVFVSEALTLATEQLGEKLARRMPTRSAAKHHRSPWNTTLLMLRVTTELWRIQFLAAVVVAVEIVIGIFSTVSS